MKKIFLKDIAKELGLSKTTVSLVLNNRGDEIKISKETQNRIKKFAKDHNYFPNQLAKGLSKGRSESIGLIIPDISNFFYAEIAGRIEKEAEKNGYTVVYSSTYEDPKRESQLINSMINRQVDGLIIASTQKNQKDIKDLKKNNIPFVLIDRHYPDISTNYVIVDNYRGMQDATKHLLKLGRKNIGFITLQSNLTALMKRFNGFFEALEKKSITLNDSSIVKLGMVEYPNQMSKALKSLINNVGVDAIIFSTHFLAATGLRELNKLGISIPDQVSIISFDEMAAFDLIAPPITAVRQPVKDIGLHAIKILLNEINRENKDILDELVLNTELVIRKSCGS